MLSSNSPGMGIDDEVCKFKLIENGLKILNFSHRAQPQWSRWEQGSCTTVSHGGEAQCAELDSKAAGVYGCIELVVDANH